MTTDIKELVKRLRIIGPALPNDKGYSTTVPQAVAYAADALEALAGEVERLKGDLSIANLKLQAKLSTEQSEEIARLKAALDRAGNPQLPAPSSALVEIRDERDRLEAAITEALNNAQDRLDYDCKCKDCTGTLTTVEATLRAALGDAS